MGAQSVRLNTTASNLANAESVSGDQANVYKPRHPIFEAVRASLKPSDGCQCESGGESQRHLRIARAGAGSL